MKLITVLLAAWFMLATTTAAHADPVSLITGLIGAISSIGAVGQLLIGVGLKVGMSLLERARAKKNQPQQAGVQGSLRTGGDNPLSFIVGTYATAGSLEYVGTWGKANKTPNAYLTQVISLSDLPITAMSNKVWISGKECTIDWSAEPVAQGYPVLEYRVEGKDFLWVLFFDGTQTAPSQFLLDCFPGGDRPWQADMIGRGIAYAVVTARMNREILTSGPSCTFVLQGIKVYDLRKDATAGGIGSQRWGVQSTYQFSDNPKVIDYNIKRGIYYDGQWVYGGQGMRAFQLPASNWMAAMNECDRQVALAGGGTEKQFRCGGEITVDYQPIEACKELDKSCNGRTAELGGIYKTICGAPGPSVYAFTDDDMVITEPQTLDPFPGLEDTVNGVNATYPEPSEAWTIKDAPPRYNATYEAADAGHRLLLDIAYPLVPYGKQVQRLTRTLLREGRNFRKQTGVLPPEAWLIEPLDAVTLTSVRNGYATKRFLMGEMDDLDNVNQGVAFTELDPSDYDWSPSFELPTSVGPLGPIELAPQPMPDDFMVEPFTVKDASGRDRRPGIKVKCPADLDDVRNIRVTVRLKSSGAEVFKSDATPYVDPFEWVISGQWTLPATQYQVSGLLIPFSNRPTEPSAWKDVTTPNIQLIADDILDGAIVAGKIADAAVTASKIMDEAVTNLKLAEAAVSTSKIQVGAVVTESIGLGAVIGSRIADAAVTGAKMAAATIDATKFASGIQPVGIIPGTTVPTTKTTDVITVNGKLYRWNGTAYVVDVASSDITGQIIGNQIADLAITNPKLAAAAVDAAKLANNAVTNTKIADDAISTPKLQANSVVASVIAASAITAKHMVLTDWSNLVPDNQMLDSSGVSWSMANGWHQHLETVFNGSKNSWVFDGGPWGSGGFTVRNSSRPFPVKGGREYRCSSGIYSNHAYQAQTRISWVNAAGAEISYFDYHVRIAAAFTGAVVSTNVTAPTDAVTAVINTFVQRDNTLGPVYFGAIGCFERNAAELIVDGSIITNMLMAGAITADKLGANSVVAGKIAAGAVSATEIAAGAITTGKLAAGSVVADKLAIGTSNNLIPNADFSAGTTNWVQIYTNGGTWAPLLIRNDSYAIPTGSLQICQQNPPVNDRYADIQVRNPDDTNKLLLAVTPGKRYEASFYAYGHRSNYARFYIEWLTAAGVIIGHDYVDVATHQNGNPQRDLGNYTRGFVFPLAPAGAVSASLFFRVYGNSAAFGSDSYTWIAHPYFGEAQPNQTEPSMWSSGVTTLISDGNVVTGSIHANKLVALSITSAQIAAGAITAGKIQAGSVTATEIAAATITGAKIAADTIGATHIAANAITAKQLVITDFNNLVPDNQIQDYSGVSWSNANGWSASGLNVFPDSLGTLIYNGPFGSGGYTAKTSSLPFSVKGGKQYRLIGSSYSNHAYECLIRVVWYDASDDQISYVDYQNRTGPAGTGDTSNVTLTAPNTARRARINCHVQRNTTAGPVYFGSFGCFERNAGELIVDGGIIANHLSANSVTAAAIAANSINAGHLQAGSITTDKLQAGSITTDKLILGGVTVDKIAPGAVSAAFSDTLAAGAWSGGNRDLSITVAHGTGSPTVLLFGTGGATAHPTDGDKTITFSMRTTGQINAIAEDVAQGKKGSGTIIAVHTPGSGTSSTTYTFRMAAGTMSSADLMTMMVQVLKR
ncbi:phage tail protein [Rhizobium sp. Root1204]|uniref:phage tail protein n=1 Tax=Rhizobium sp. Root1204 TaxID=1736428 RepID=UPI000714EB4E|nr:phage tail protein [Rhizobium sp. Root1204]KQV31154.1 hypothetical protein ASC96_08155 [Rhizobium sp. Root1204]